MVNFFSHICVVILSLAQSIDSLKDAVPDIPDTEKVDNYVNISRFYHTSSADSVIIYGEKALGLANDLDYAEGIAYAHWAIGIGLRMSSYYDSSLRSFELAKNKAIGLRNDVLNGEIMMGIGGVHYYQQRPDSAMKYFIKAAEYFKSTDRADRIASAASNLGIILNDMGRDEQAVDYFHQSLKYSKNEGLLNIQLPTMINLASLYENQGNYDSAIFYADAVYQISKKKNLTFGISRALLYLPRIYLLAELNNKALISAREGVDLFQELGDDRNRLRMIYLEARALKELGQYTQALKKCEEFLEEVKIFDNYFMEDIYLLLSDLYEDINKVEKALYYHRLYIETYKKASVEQKKEELLELEIKYESAKKEQEIESLNNKNQIQNLQIRQKNAFILIGGLIFIIILLSLFLYFRQKSLNKENRLLSLEQRFLRSQMNPHFIFNALGAIQNYILSGDPMTAAGFIAKFSSLIRQVLQYSRKEYVSLEEELSALRNYLDVQQLRFENNFEYSIQVEDKVSSQTQVPPMFIQPFVENSLEHGISKIDIKGKIDIDIGLVAHKLKITIEDNGPGTSPKNEHDHISLASVITQERLELFSRKSDNFDLIIENIHGEKDEIVGVRVILTLPHN